MEPPATPKKPRRTPAKDKEEPAGKPAEPEKPKSTRARKTTKAPAKSAQTPTAPPPAESTAMPRAAQPTSKEPAVPPEVAQPTPPAVKPAPVQDRAPVIASSGSAAATVQSSTQSSTTPAATPAPSTAKASVEPPVMPGARKTEAVPWPPPDPADSTAPKRFQVEVPRRIKGVWTTLLSRDVAIARKAFARSRESARVQADNVSKRMSKNASKEMTDLGQRMRRMSHDSADAIDRGLANFQTDLERHDTTVLITTVIMIVACVVVMAVLLALFR
jgi:hypothetical protein